MWPSNSPHVTPAARAEANRFTGLLVPQPIEGRSRLTSSSHLGTDTVAGAHPVPTHSPSLLRAKREDAGHPTRTLPSRSSLESGGRGRGRVMNVNVSKRKGIFTPKEVRFNSSSKPQIPESLSVCSLERMGRNGPGQVVKRGRGR